MLNDGINADGRLRNDPQAAMLRTKRPEELGGSDLIGVPLGVPLVVAEGPDDPNFIFSPAFYIDVLACLSYNAVSCARVSHIVLSHQRPSTMLIRL